MAKATYRASTTTLATTGTASKSFFAIIGSATKRVTVTRIRVSCPTIASVGYFAIKIVKNSTATASPDNTLTNVPLNSGFAAATAAVYTWTSDQTVGTAVGIIDAWRMLAQATTAAAAGFPDSHVFTYGDIAAGRVDTPLYDVNTSGVVLNGVAEELSLQWAATTGATTTLSVSVEWIEENP
jgi:hypothetical protein